MANRQDHVVVFVITSLLFLTGVFSGLVISKDRMNEVQDRINDFESSIKSLEVGLLINDALNNETIYCNFLQEKIKETKLDLEELGKKAVEYEEQSKIKDPSYVSIKSDYNSIRAEYWLMLEKLKKECNNNYTTVLFFYRTNVTCNECIDQGVILSHLASIMPDIHVVSLDSDEDLLIIRTLKEAYGINSVPSMVIDASTIITGLMSENELSFRLNKSDFN